jgi:hypothetical protein
MANIRDRIRMDPDELAAFLAEERTVICASNGVRGFPHLMPLWYVLRSPAGESGPGPELWAWTYAKSQKTRNLERDPRATLQVEAGETYEALRGVMLETEVAIHRDHGTIVELGLALMRRYAAARGEPPVRELPEATRRNVLSQAPKRVALQFVERRRASWDHRKFAAMRR